MANLALIKILGWSALTNLSMTEEKPSVVENDEPEQFRKLFIGGLSLSTTDEGLREFYGQFGNIVDCVVMRDSATKKSRGFGFVSYNAKAEVDKCMAARPHTIDGKQVDPKRAVPRELSSRGEANVSTNRLYVSGVREEHTQEAFQTHFSDYGTVTKVEIITDKQTNKPRGFGFITFDDYDAVDKCVLKKSHMICGFRCDVKKALSRDEMARAQQSERDRMERGSRAGGRGPPGRGPPGGGWGPPRGQGGPAGNFREPHGSGGYGAPWGNQGGGGGGWGQQGGYGGGGYGGGGYGGAPQAQGSWGNESWGAGQSAAAGGAWSGGHGSYGGGGGYTGGWSSGGPPGRGGPQDRGY
ncbi:unnamed protein product [Bursaphelenchus okinawaensis]|uniref:RRM domain-containing protein n=1 Tax=Bursaphelenchus okinawaensis TaxID=465554 RepID=A0A811LI53_9BILA|nr:unnamed protein product [Bursaphelenchus okinawaensis]CAG9123679.1 unnamed protein product [Bursaphelenchus okinawaensis]